MSASLKHNVLHSNRMIHESFKNRFVRIISKNRLKTTIPPRIGHHVRLHLESDLSGIFPYIHRLPEKSGLSGLVYQDSETEAVPVSPSFIYETGSRVIINDFWWKKPSNRAYGGFSCVSRVILRLIFRTLYILEGTTDRSVLWIRYG